MVELSAKEIIERCRALEHELTRLDPDGTYYDSLQEEIQRLGHEYQRISEETVGGETVGTIKELRAARVRP
jgi:hypothetical protein